MDDTKNPINNVLESHDDEQLVQTAWKAYEYGARGIMSIKEMYKELPSELIPHREYYLSLIESSTKFLVETGNWYKKEE